MRILHVSAHGCIRVWKEAVALKGRGHSVDLLANRAPYGANRFDLTSLWADRDHLQRAVAASPADIVHVHNEPDWLVGAVAESTRKPIVFDCHDLESLRWVGHKGPEQDELVAFRAATGIIHISEPAREYAEQHHGNGKPTGILPCYIPAEFCRDELPESVSWSSIVYEGGLSEEDERVPLPGGQFQVSMRSQQSVVQAFIAQGFNFYIYPATATKTNIYEDLGAVVARPLAFRVLLRGMRAYGFGFVGSPYSSPLMQAALPNKLFEYLSQGVVPVILNANRAAQYVRERGIGIVLDGLDNLQEQLADGPEIRKRILEQRDEFTMERHIGAVTDVYEAVA